MSWFRKLDFKLYFFNVIGCFLFSVSLNCFAEPCGISTGGIVGVGQLIFKFTGIPIGILCLILNIPIIILGVKKLGKNKMLKNVALSFFMYVLIDITAVFLPRYEGNAIISAILSGVIGGIGLSLIFMTGLATGGTGLLSAIICDSLPYMDVGKTILILDGSIVVISSFILCTEQDILISTLSKVIYSTILLFIQSKVIDYLIRTIKVESEKIVSIISENAKFILNSLQKELKSNISSIETSGENINANREVLIGKIKKKDINKAYKIIREIDNKALVILNNPK